jgi:hypothetical protein
VKAFKQYMDASAMVFGVSISRWTLVAILLGVMAMNALGGCTVVRYSDGQKSLTIADIRISGSAIDLDATLNEVGSLSVNREQGSAGEAVAEAAEAVILNR